MEYNKERAARAKAIAEKKFHETDINGAKKFAVKAHKLYPALDGLREFLATIEIYISNQKIINGEADLYGILGVRSSADTETIWEQYRKLALILHPLKNKSVGAEGAYQILCNAWSELSNKAKKCSLRNCNDQNGFVSCHSSTPSTLMNRRTFWTACNYCQMKFEYSRECLNKRLLCQSCFQFFVAADISGSTSPGCAYNSHVKRNSTDIRMPLPASKADPEVIRDYSPRLISDLIKKKDKKPDFLKKKVKKPELIKRNEKKPRKKSSDDMFLSELIIRKPIVCGLPSRSLYATIDFEDGDEGCTTSNNGITKTSRLDMLNNDRWSRKRERSNHEIRNMLMMKAKKAIYEKIKEWSTTEKNNIQANGEGKIAIKQNPSDFLSMSVPDSDFHDFDKDRVEKSFDKNQVWAAYDDDDGMPRYYAHIHSVLSRKPFRMKISWLNSKSNREFGSQNWISSGFRKTSGDFYVGKHTINSSLTSFSHKVEFTKGVRGAVMLYPKKGQIWAVYKNWSSDWNQFTSEDVVHKYEVVEVIEDYKEEIGVKVAHLLKVPGFKAVFRRDHRTEIFPREEIFRLSHQVPSYPLSGKGSVDVALHSCVELDPASLPLELLQVHEIDEKHEKAMAGTKDGSIQVYKRRRLI